MKLKLKIIFAVLIAVAFVYTACKKTGASNTSGSSLTPQQVTSQIALNISETLFGGVSPIDVSSGLNAPSGFAVHTKGKIVNDLNNPFCGLVVDTTLTETETEGDTTASISGSVKFNFSCTNDVLTGYTTDDNLNVSLSTSQFSLVYKIGENLTLLSLNPADENSNFSINGTLNSTTTFDFKTASAGKSGTATFDYNLKNVVFDINGDVISGSATFTTTGTGAHGTWNYSGTITFLGNYEATVTINGTTYKVNLQTGVVG
jgi:hypothetical protein